MRNLFFIFAMVFATHASLQASTDFKELLGSWQNEGGLKTGLGLQIDDFGRIRIGLRRCVGLDSFSCHPWEREAYEVGKIAPNGDILVQCVSNSLDEMPQWKVFGKITQDKLVFNFPNHYSEFSYNLELRRIIKLPYPSCTQWTSISAQISATNELKLYGQDLSATLHKVSRLVELAVGKYRSATGDEGELIYPISSDKVIFSRERNEHGWIFEEEWIDGEWIHLKSKTYNNAFYKISAHQKSKEEFTFSYVNPDPSLSYSYSYKKYDPLSEKLSPLSCSLRSFKVQRDDWSGEEIYQENHDTGMLTGTSIVVNGKHTLRLWTDAYFPAVYFDLSAPVKTKNGSIPDSFDLTVTHAFTGEVLQTRKVDLTRKILFNNLYVRHIPKVDVDTTNPNVAYLDCRREKDLTPFRLF